MQAIFSVDKLTGRDVGNLQLRLKCRPHGQSRLPAQRDKNSRALRREDLFHRFGRKPGFQRQRFAEELPIAAPDRGQYFIVVKLALVIEIGGAMLGQSGRVEAICA